MKYKALATIVLLLLPMMPLALANQPTPPLWYTELRIRPFDSNFTGPCIVSTEFTKDVYLWSDKALTGVGVYAFDFYVWWTDNQGISLSHATVHNPWPSVSSFVVKSEEGTDGAGWDYYHLAITAIGNSTINPALELGATGVFNASLLTLTFHIDDEPCYPDTWSGVFLIGAAGGAVGGMAWNSDPPTLPLPANAPILSTGCGVRIERLEIDNARFFIFSSQPNIDPLVKADDPGYVNATHFITKAIGETHTIVIALSNITKAYGYKFTLTWAADWYKTDVQHVTILPAFAPPYEYLTVTLASGSLTIELKRPCEKDRIHAAGYTPIVEVAFVTKNPSYNVSVPYNYDTFFTITDATLYVKCANNVTQYTPQNGLLISPPVHQMVRPKSEADLNLDGVVDIEDLAELAHYYGVVHPWSDLASPVSPVPVDIFDLVYVAKRYGDP